MNMRNQRLPQEIPSPSLIKLAKQPLKIYFWKLRKSANQKKKKSNINKKTNRKN